MAPTSPCPSPSPNIKSSFPFPSLNSRTHPTLATTTTSTPLPRRHAPVSLRARAGTRATISILILFVLVFIFNEVRCLHHGCTSRGGLYDSGDKAMGFVGGGSVVGKVSSSFGSSGEDGEEGEDKQEETESVWGTHGVVGGWFFKPRPRPSAMPSSSGSSGGDEAPIVEILETGETYDYDEYVYNDSDDDGYGGEEDEEEEEGGTNYDEANWNYDDTYETELMPPDPIHPPEQFFTPKAPEEEAVDSYSAYDDNDDDDDVSLADKLAKEKAEYFDAAHLSPSTHLPGQAGLPDPGTALASVGSASDGSSVKDGWFGGMDGFIGGFRN